jgi:hypothetical protein
MRVLVAEDRPRLAASGASVLGWKGMADVALDGHDRRADTSPISSVVIVLDGDLSLVHGDEVSPQLPAPDCPAAGIVADPRDHGRSARLVDDRPRIAAAARRTRVLSGAGER